MENTIKKQVKEKLKQLWFLAVMSAIKSGPFAQYFRCTPFAQCFGYTKRSRNDVNSVQGNNVNSVQGVFKEIKSLAGHDLFWLRGNRDGRLLIRDPLKAQCAVLSTALPVTELCSALASQLEVGECKLFWPDSTEAIQNGCIRDLLIDSRPDLLLVSKSRPTFVQEQIIEIIKRNASELSNIQTQDIYLVPDFISRTLIKIRGFEYAISANAADDIFIPRRFQDETKLQADLSDLRCHTRELVELLRRHPHLESAVSKDSAFSDQEYEPESPKGRLLDIRRKLAEIAHKHSASLHHAPKRMINLYINTVNGQIEICLIGTTAILNRLDMSTFDIMIDNCGLNESRPIQQDDQLKLESLYDFFITDVTNVDYANKIKERITEGLTTLHNKQVRLAEVGSSLQKEEVEQLNLLERAMKGLEKFSDIKPSDFAAPINVTEEMIKEVGLAGVGYNNYYRAVTDIYDTSGRIMYITDSSHGDIQGFRVSDGEIEFSDPRSIPTERLLVPAIPAALVGDSLMWEVNKNRRQLELERQMIDAFVRNNSIHFTNILRANFYYPLQFQFHI